MHPWAAQLCDDLKLIQHIDDGDTFLADLGPNLHRLLWTDELRLRFVELDLNQLYAYWKSVSVAPMAPYNMDELDVEVDDTTGKKLFTCYLFGCEEKKVWADFSQ